MRDDTLLFIITHKRAEKQITLRTLRKAGYNGKIYFVVDDADPELEAYQKKYGKAVLVFSKDEYWEKTDTYTNRKIWAACVYARNACIDFAKALGCKYFIVCDDDITRFNLKVPRNGKMRTKRVTDIERVFEKLVDYLDNAGKIKAISVAEDGAYIGGVNQDVASGVKYTLAKCMLYRADSPVYYCGSVYEDMTTLFGAYQRGDVAFSVMGISQSTVPDKTGEGGVLRYVFYIIGLCKRILCGYGEA